MKKIDEILVVVPPNDPEAVLITRILEVFSIPFLTVGQGHGASIDKEPRLVERIEKRAPKKVVIIEAPGPETEAKLEELGFDVILIDHHEYTGLDRAHNDTGERLPSSLDQFLALFEISDEELQEKGFDPRVVHGVAIMDRGFVWELRDEGYSEEEIRSLIDYQRDLMGDVRNMAYEEEKEAAARRMWENREEWNGYYIVHNDTDYQVRSRISLIIALEIKKPTPLILVEPVRTFIYVQESPAAPKLFEEFGGFTFGNGNNWGYKNENGKPEVWLEDVKRVLG